MEAGRRGQANGKPNPTSTGKHHQTPNPMAAILGSRFGLHHCIRQLPSLRATSYLARMPAPAHADSRRYRMWSLSLDLKRLRISTQCKWLAKSVFARMGAYQGSSPGAYSATGSQARNSQHHYTGMCTMNARLHALGKEKYAQGLAWVQSMMQNPGYSLRTQHVLSIGPVKSNRLCGSLRVRQTSARACLHVAALAPALRRTRPLSCHTVTFGIVHAVQHAPTLTAPS